MFERCRAWRHQLTRRAEGSLPPAQWGALEDHLASCPSCRAAAEADQTLHDVLSGHIGLLSPQQASAFDARVMKALALPPRNGFRAELERLLRAAQGHWNTMPLTFFSQIASGALVAASLTVVCVLSAMHPAASNGMPSPHFGGRSALHAAYSEPPVPLEMLLEHPSPRAALLWTTPSGSRSRLSEQDSDATPIPPGARQQPADETPMPQLDERPPDAG
ncbi:MAG TPA: zf-HC2 domain-containing protein [Chthonomonadaceae bacterium]|nr:zf-HC2 domain-containing protein [Chthonomonadaceae bacterium]